MATALRTLASNLAVPYPRPAAPGPSFTGTQKSGSVLTCAPGDWTGAGTITYAYQWKNVTALGVVSNCAGAGNGTAAVTLGAGDVGDTVYCEVTATSDATDALGVALSNVVNTLSSGDISA